MRIVLVNWAKVWEGASQGGGVNQYVQALALELVKRGHDVVSLSSGTEHSPIAPGQPNPPPSVRRHHDWFGIKVFEVVNSPVLAPSLAQFERPMDEVSCPSLEHEVGRLFDLLRPGVVHFNNLEGFSIGCVSRARAAGARVVFSLHNYATVCPQVYLLQGHRVLCRDFQNGHACATCVKVVPVEEERQKHRARSFAGAAPAQGTTARAAWNELKDALRWMPRSLRAGVRLAKVTIAPEREPMPALPGQAVRTLEDATGQLTVPGETRVLHSPSGDVTLSVGDQRGRSPHLMAELDPPRARDCSLPQYQPLSNEITPEPESSRAPNEYGQRRAAMVEMLSSCDRVLAVSGFVRDKFVSMGVKPSVIRTLPIGSRINRVVALKPELAFAPPAFLRPPVPMGVEQRAVRLLFMGFNNYYKGLGFFADALEGLEPEVLRKLHISVFALEGQTIEWMFRRLEPRLAGLRYGYQYHYHDIPWFCGGRDMVVVPSLWWDNGPQTVFESLACGVPVLGANIGGIPDAVKHGHNGLLFRANDREDLRARLREITSEPWRIDDLRKNVRPPKSIEDHAVEMERVYAGQDEDLKVEVAAGNAAAAARA